MLAVVSITARRCKPSGVRTLLRDGFCLSYSLFSDNDGRHSATYATDTVEVAYLAGGFGDVWG